VRDRSRTPALIARGVAIAVTLASGVARAQTAEQQAAPAPPPLVPPKAIDAGRVPASSVGLGIGIERLCMASSGIKDVTFFQQSSQF
jgi:hypothetical protein